MEKPEKRIHHTVRHGKIYMTVVGIIILAVCIAGLRMLKEKDMTPSVLYRDMKNGTLLLHDTSDVKAIRVMTSAGETWEVIQTNGDGQLFLADDLSAAVDKDLASGLLSAASAVTYDEVLAETAQEYSDQLDAFGLSTPKLTATYIYSDESEITLHIGEQTDLADESYYFMKVDGDERLFAADAGTAELLDVEKLMLRTVIQPDIQSSRLDRITVINDVGEKKIEWSLEGSITDKHETDNWYLTAPFRFPADADVIAGLKSNASKLILGAYIAGPEGEADGEYGLDLPSYTIELHMSEGMTGHVTEGGSYDTVMHPEETIRFAIGCAKNDMTDYVLYDHHVYTMNHFMIDVFTGAEPLDSAARYPFSTAVTDLSSVVVECEGAHDEYVLSSVISEDGTDENGEKKLTSSDICKKNGKQIDRGMFEAAWERLLVVTYTGILPEYREITGLPERVYTVRTVSGRAYTVSLYPYDALHDVVAVDGISLFYLIKDGLTELP